MDETEAKRIYSSQRAICKALGGDLRRRCREQGVPDELINKFIADDELLDRFLSRFDDIGERKAE
jgi:hypothetical protein